MLLAICTHSHRVPIPASMISELARFTLSQIVDSHASSTAIPYDASKCCNSYSTGPSATCGSRLRKMNMHISVSFTSQTR